VHKFRFWFDRLLPSAYRARMDQLPPLPRRVAWFAPWTWDRRWLAATLVVAALLGYLLSAGPVFRILSVSFPPYRLQWAIVDFYHPLVWFAARSEWFDAVLAWYLNVWGVPSE
jgi:hypothetical protein